MGYSWPFWKPNNSNASPESFSRASVFTQRTLGNFSWQQLFMVQILWDRNTAVQFVSRLVCLLYKLFGRSQHPCHERITPLGSCSRQDVNLLSNSPTWRRTSRDYWGSMSGSSWLCRYSAFEIFGMYIRLQTSFWDDLTPFQFHWISLVCQCDELWLTGLLTRLLWAVVLPKLQPQFVRRDLFGGMFRGLLCILIIYTKIHTSNLRQSRGAEVSKVICL